ncbi:exonuclease V a 5' deoxyribonuclease-domain-containing protein [Dactylonectria macrodidyma]|uniref:Exonuclease V a 5' deoxyribonuclease-domain-containing protein n=1 Tax=Dactylonectria macrodidyma TaxID=307937 RepID=A0A9P9EAT4_9HYPO|nr:exonuclease V a 5' deoxyribonuclease-domain-containing protein [Dactylonectria macrodidyma]
MTDSDSEFGYDFSVEEEELLGQLVSNNPTTPHQKSPPRDAKLAVIDSVPARSNVICGDVTAETRHLPARGLEDSKTNHLAEQIPAFSAIPNGQDVCYPDLRGALSALEADAQRPVKDEPGCDTTIDDTSFGDDRSPLQRFRSYPRKPLTVSDLNAGAWCELQYWYTLTRLPGGRRTRTAAMRQGTKVHQKLEDEVHTTVKIDIESKEDGFGLKLWNLVQGLRTLRDTGLTRELEVWGMLDGNLVNGVIDGVSYQNPNPEFEEELSSQEPQGNQRQSQLTDYFPPSQSEQARQPGPKIYLTDVKTRGSLAPVSKAQLRPAKIQLLLYHRFLSGMAAGELDFLKVFRRYGLDPDEPFSDAFIAQVGSLHDEIFFDAATPSEREFEMVNTAQETASENAAEPDLLKYRTLRELIPLVEKELASTFPYGENTMGHLLRVQYVHRSDGREIDQHDFPVSRQALDSYLSRYMAWWRGERKASGVDIEEAFKCQTCEFVSDCSWRQDMDGERLRKAQQRVRAMRRD